MPLTIVLIATSPLDRLMFPRDYPALQPRLSNVQLVRAGLQEYTAGPERSGVQLTLTIDGLASQTALGVDDLRVVLTAPDGDRYDSGWQAQYRNGRVLAPGGTDVLQVQVAHRYLGLHRAEPLTLQGEIAFTELAAGQSLTSHAPYGSATYSMPDVGICTNTPDGVSCRVAFRQPDLTLVAAQSHDGHRVDPAAETITFAGWMGGLESEPADVSFTPVQTAFANLTEVGSHDGQRRFLPCAGDWIRVTRYDVRQHFRYAFRAKDVLLDEPVKAGIDR